MSLTFPPYSPPFSILLQTFLGEKSGGKVESRRSSSSGDMAFRKCTKWNISRLLDYAMRSLFLQHLALLWLGDSGGAERCISVVGIWHYIRDTFYASPSDLVIYANFQ